MMAFGQYQIFKGTLDLSAIDDTFTGELDTDIDGKELSLGLLVLFEQESSMEFYAGAEFIASSDFKADETAQTNSFDYKRTDKAGLLFGVSKPIKNDLMHLYGNVSVIGDPSFHLGVTRDF